MQVVDEETGEVYMEHTVEMGDVWRACQTKDLPIKDWVRLAVSRARATGDTTIFWLDALRGHDYQLIQVCVLFIQKVNKYSPPYTHYTLHYTLLLSPRTESE